MAETARSTASAVPSPEQTSSLAASRTKPAQAELLAKYEALCYRLVGERLDQSREEDSVLEVRLKQAGLRVTPGMYRALTIMTTAIATGAAAAFSFSVFDLLLHPAFWWGYVLVVTGVTAGSVVMGFRSIVSVRIANRKDQLERELPFTLSELSVLASTGASPIRLIRRMAQRPHDPKITGEFRRIIYKVDIQGKDLITALAETARESASSAVRESFWDFANMIHQGGNLDEYLRAKSDSVLQMKRVVQKEFIERLSTFLDMYVALVLVGIMMVAIGVFVLNAFGQTIGGLDANEMLLLLTFGFVPLAVVMTVIMISIAYARAE